MNTGSDFAHGSECASDVRLSYPLLPLFESIPPLTPPTHLQYRELNACMQNHSPAKAEPFACERGRGNPISGILSKVVSDG